MLYYSYNKEPPDSVSRGSMEGATETESPLKSDSLGVKRQGVTENHNNPKP